MKNDTFRRLIIFIINGEFSYKSYLRCTDCHSYAGSCFNTPPALSISDADIVVLRYAHVLLMIAEAENEAHGATTTALNAINEVRTRSGQPAIEAGISQDDLRERIRNEWRIETCFEGLRYFQLKRWKLMDKRVNGVEDPAYPGYIKVYKPAFEFFPIPQSEIDKAVVVFWSREEFIDIDEEANLEKVGEDSLDEGSNRTVHSIMETFNLTWKEALEEFITYTYKAGDAEGGAIWL